MTALLHDGYKVVEKITQFSATNLQPTVQGAYNTPSYCHYYNILIVITYW